MSLISERAGNVLLIAGLVFILMCGLALTGQAAGSAPDGRSLAADTPTLTPTPGCSITRYQADYGQYYGGMVITPLEQHDEDGGRLWVTTWRVVGNPGGNVFGRVDVLHCTGVIDDLVYCTFDRATYTNTFNFNLTIPVSGTADFSIVDEVNCCQIAQADLISVNDFRWGSSWFDRKAVAPPAWCAVVTYPTSTPTVAATHTGTATQTATPSATATNTPTATDTATPTRTFTSTGTSTRTSTPTATDTALPTETATVTPTHTAVRLMLPIVMANYWLPTYTPTATATGTATRTPGHPVVTPTIVAGLKSPKALVLDAATQTLFAVARDADEVEVLSLLDYSIEKRIAVGDAPFGAAILDGILYVANFDSATVSRIDVNTRTRILPDIAVGPEPSWVDVDPVAGRVYVTTHGNGGLAVIRWGILEHVLGAERGAFAVAVDSVGRRVYVTNRDVNSVTVFHADTNNRLATWGIAGSPFGIAVDPNSGNVYIAHGMFPNPCPANKLTVYNRAGVFLGRMTIGDTCDGGWLAVNPANGRVYIAATAVDQVWILEADRTVRATLCPADGIGHAPFGLAVDPARGLVYVGNKGDGTISVISDP